MNGTKKYIQPYTIKPKLLAWSEINLSEVEILISLFQNQSSNDCYCYLERFFELSASKFREKILLDLHYFAIKFAVQECSFNKIQISSFVSILRALHMANQETPFDNFKQLLEYFHGLMICHSVNRPPFCIKIFDSQTLAKSISFIKNTYFKNYKLYKYTFTPIIGINVKINYSSDKQPPTPITSYYPDISLQTEQYNGKSDHSATEPAKITPRKALTGVLPEPSIPTMSSFSSENDMKSYVRQFIIEELGTEPIKEKLSELEDEIFRNKHDL